MPQQEFAKESGFAKRTIGTAERGTHPPSLALRHALDQILEQASDAQRERFLAAVAAQEAADLAESSDRVDPTVAVPTSRRQEDMEVALMSAADESARLLAVDGSVQRW